MNLKINQKIYFHGENLPMTIKSINDKFAICTRKFDLIEDDILSYKMEMQPYKTKQEIYETLKNEIIYSCIGFSNNYRSTHDLIFNPYDFNKLKDINQLLKDLTNGTVKLSRRNKCELIINKIK